MAKRIKNPSFGENESIYTCPSCAAISIVDYSNNWCARCKTWNGGKGIKDPTWICENGVALKVSHMDTDHIQRCVGMILSRHNWRERYMEPLLKELKKRKETDKDGEIQAVESVDPPG